MFLSLDRPKTVSVSISPSGEIVEGRTVTLTCSSDANPPVEYNWFKGTLFKSKGNTHIINSISSEDSGEYRCKTKNQYGEKYSDNVTFNVLYPPKNVSVSISPSGEIVEGSLVTLTCSSDANPPVELYTWYKVNESSPVGSGQSYGFTLSSSSSGWFYCVAQNKYGIQKAAAVFLTLNEKKEEEVLMKLLCLNVYSSPLDDTYTSLDLQTRSSSDVYHTLANVKSSPPDDTYTSLDPQSISPDYDTLTSARKEK
ncbi:B-cell receptor CD22-like [Clarias gariepinus]